MLIDAAEPRSGLRRVVFAFSRVPGAESGRNFTGSFRISDPPLVLILFF